MYILNYEVNLVWVLLAANTAVIRALILILIELRETRKLRKAFEHMFGHYEEVMAKDTKIFWKELEELKIIVCTKNGETTVCTSENTTSREEERR